MRSMRSSAGSPKNEDSPAAKRDPKEFMGLGGKGDQELFGNEESVYSTNETTEVKR